MLIRSDTPDQISPATSRSPIPVHQRRGLSLKSIKTSVCFGHPARPKQIIRDRQQIVAHTHQKASRNLTVGRSISLSEKSTSPSPSDANRILQNRIVCFDNRSRSGTSPQGRLDPDLCTIIPRPLHPVEPLTNGQTVTRAQPQDCP